MAVNIDVHLKGRLNEMLRELYKVIQRMINEKKYYRHSYENVDMVTASVVEKPKMKP